MPPYNTGLKTIINTFLSFIVYHKIAEKSTTHVQHAEQETCDAQNKKKTEKQKKYKSSKILLNPGLRDISGRKAL